MAFFDGFTHFPLSVVLSSSLVVLSAPEGPVPDPGRRQGRGLKKDVLGTRTGM